MHSLFQHEYQASARTPRIINSHQRVRKDPILTPQLLTFTTPQPAQATPIQPWSTPALTFTESSISSIIQESKIEESKQSFDSPKKVKKASNPRKSIMPLGSPRQVGKWTMKNIYSKEFIRDKDDKEISFEERRAANSKYAEWEDDDDMMMTNCVGGLMNVSDTVPEQSMDETECIGGVVNVREPPPKRRKLSTPRDSLVLELQKEDKKEDSVTGEVLFSNIFADDEAPEPETTGMTTNGLAAILCAESPTGLTKLSPFNPNTEQIDFNYYNESKEFNTSPPQPASPMLDDFSCSDPFSDYLQREKIKEWKPIHINLSTDHSCYHRINENYSQNFEKLLEDDVSWTLTIGLDTIMKNALIINRNATKKATLVLSDTCVAGVSKRKLGEYSFLLGKRLLAAIDKESKYVRHLLLPQSIYIYNDISITIGNFSRHIQLNPRNSGIGMLPQILQLLDLTQFLHSKWGLVVGNISPKTVALTEEPSPSVLLIDFSYAFFKSDTSWSRALRISSESFDDDSAVGLAEKLQAGRSWPNVSFVDMVGVAWVIHKWVLGEDLQSLSPNLESAEGNGELWKRGFDALLKDHLLLTAMNVFSRLK